MQHTEISLGNPNKIEKTVKINDFLHVLKSESLIKTGPIQIFPGVVVVFAVKNFPTTGFRRKGFKVDNETKKDMIDGTTFFGVQILQEDDTSTLQLAGYLELEMNGTLKKANFGDVEKNRYELVDLKLIIKPPGKLYTDSGSEEMDREAFYFEAGEDWEKKKIDLKLKFTLYRPRVIRRIEAGDEVLLCLPQNWKSQLSLPDLNRSIMRDERTANLTLLCQEKTFKVHKAFFCSRSSVFRAMIQSNMREGNTAEINIEDEMVDEKTLASEEIRGIRGNGQRGFLLRGG